MPDIVKDDCRRCDGCGQVADSERQEPWSEWMGLPVSAASAVFMGLVKPIPCPACGGSGKEDGDGELKPEVEARLRESLKTPREDLLTADEMQQKLEGLANADPD